MFDSSLIVQSAISSFNNAAIIAPSFFWSSVLMLPLFLFAKKLGAVFQTVFPAFADNKKRLTLFSFIAEILIALWLIVMHGNYSILRDTETILPFIIAGALFLTVSSIVQKLREINPDAPAIWQKLTKNKFISFVSLVLLSAIVGLSGFHSWWGILLQGSAFFAGAVVGRYKSRSFEPIKFTTFIMFVLTAIILMQPEFFRFGQLGNLTVLHILFISLIGAVSMAIFALNMAKPHARFGLGFFIKLKWLFRIAVLTSFSLFLFTESILIFWGLCAALFLCFYISILHQSENISDNLIKKLWAVLLFLFGAISFMPVIMVAGILFWGSLPKLKVWNKSKFLL